MGAETFIGVDVSKDWLDFAVSQHENSLVLKFNFDNTISGYKELIKALRSNRIVIGKRVLITLEHTGGYGDNFIRFMVKKKCQVCIESAVRIKKSIGLQRGKNDSIDAERILEYTKKNEATLKLWTLPREPIRLLRDLLSNRERLIRLKNSMTTPLSILKSTHKRHNWLKIKRINQTGIDGLNISIKNINDDINKIVQSDIEIKKQCDLLKGIPGIGLIIALQLITRTNEFTRYKTGRELACLAGVAPFEYSSGTITGKGHVNFYHNKVLKKYLHMGAVSCINSKSDLKKYYERKVTEGKHKMLVINNISNKMLLRAAAVIRKGEPYKPML